MWKENIAKLRQMSLAPNVKTLTEGIQALQVTPYLAFASGPGNTTAVDAVLSLTMALPHLFPPGSAGAGSHQQKWRATVVAVSKNMSDEELRTACAGYRALSDDEDPWKIFENTFKGWSSMCWEGLISQLCSACGDSNIICSFASVDAQDIGTPYHTVQQIIDSLLAGRKPSNDNCTLCHNRGSVKLERWAILSKAEVLVVNLSKVTTSDLNLENSQSIWVHIGENIRQAETTELTLVGGVTKHGGNCVAFAKNTIGEWYIFDSTLPRGERTTCQKMVPGAPVFLLYAPWEEFEEEEQMGTTLGTTPTVQEPSTSPTGSRIRTTLGRTTGNATITGDLATLIGSVDRSHVVINCGPAAPVAQMPVREQLIFEVEARTLNRAGSVELFYFPCTPGGSIFEGLVKHIQKGLDADGVGETVSVRCLAVEGMKIFDEEGLGMAIKLKGWRGTVKMSMIVDFIGRK